MNNLWKLHIYRTMLIRDIIKEKLFTHVCLPNYFRFVQWNWTCSTVCTFFSPQYSPCQYDLCLWKKTSFYKFFVSIKSIILTYSWYHELMNWWENQGYLRENCTAQKMKFPIKDCFSKCDQIRRKLRIWSLLLKKSLMENFIFCGSVKDGKFPWSLKGLSIESLGYVRVT